MTRSKDREKTAKDILDRDLRAEIILAITTGEAIKEELYKAQNSLISKFEEWCSDTEAILLKVGPDYAYWFNHVRCFVQMGSMPPYRENYDLHPVLYARIDRLKQFITPDAIKQPE